MRARAGSAAGGGRRPLTFLRQYYRSVPVEDLADRDPVNVYGPAMAHRHLAQHRPQGRALVRVYTPTLEEYGWDPGRSVVQIVTDDMPFLVDSVTTELDRHDIGTHLIVHPQMRVRRDLTGELLGPDRENVTGQVIRESWMHIEIDRQADHTVLKELESDLQRVLLDVRCAVEDFAKMRALAVQTAEDLAANPPPLDPAQAEDGMELLRWLADGHFTFLGYREYRLEDTDGGVALRGLPGTGLGILRADKAGSASFAALPPKVRAKAREKQLLIVTKANSRATVYKPHYLDYVGVKVFSPEGEVIGERRFLGLFTHVAYNESISRIPVLRRKLAEVLERAGLSPDSHDGKDLMEILETYPRTELFQMSVDELLPIALGVLRLRERKQVKLFLRRDDYGRYISCLIFLPRDRYTTKVRLHMQRILMKALGGTSLDYSTMIGESALARLYIVIRGERGTPLGETPVDVDELEARLAATTRTWEDDLSAAIGELCPEEDAPRLLRRYGSAFPEGYKADFPARTAVADLKRLETLGEDPNAIGMNLYEPYGAAEGSGASSSTGWARRSRCRGCSRCCSGWASRWWTSGRTRSTATTTPTPGTPGSTTSACGTRPPRRCTATSSSGSSRTRSPCCGAARWKTTASTRSCWPAGSPGSRPRSSGRTPSICGRPGPRSASRTSRGCCAATCGWPGSWCGCSRPGSTRGGRTTAGRRSATR
ncbi:hypothetical protein GCM10027612_25590 [Microbispora bryophytorum subsp. camponoti]